MATLLNRIINRLEVEGREETARALRDVAKSLMKTKTGTTATVREIKTLNKGSEVLTYNLKKMKDGTVGISAGFSKTITDMRRFRMEWLSMLFFSMNVQRQLQRVMSQSVTTFMKIAGETNRTNQTLAAFGAQINFIRFTLGRAIGEVFEPLLPTFVKLTESIVDFVEQHPDTVVWSLVGAWGAFKALNILSQVALISIWFGTMADKIGLVLTKIPLLKTALKNLSAVALLGISLIITYKGFEILKEGLTEGDWKKILKGLLVGGIGGAGAGIAISILAGTSLLPGALIGAAITVSVGILFSFYWMKKEKQGKTTARALFETLFPDLAEPRIGLNVPVTGLFGIDDLIKGFKKMREVGILEIGKVGGALKILGFLIGSPQKGSFPIVYSLIQAEKEWKIMSAVSITQIRAIITELNNIPRTIVTTHYIRTVRMGVRGFQTGTQYVPRTGLYMLHQGERVIPQNQINMGNINVTAHTNANPQEIAQMISRILNDELRRYI